MAVSWLVGMGLQTSIAQVNTEVVWQRCLGGSDVDWGTNLTETSDGGFVAIGWSASNDGDAIDNHGNYDILVTKLDANGEVLWKRSYGGSAEDHGYGCIEASDGSIMIIGNTYSTDGDVTANHGGQDLWVLKLSPVGAIIWQRTYGGSNMELGGQIQETSDGGFIIHCASSSGDGDVVGYHAGLDLQDNWVLKINASGTLEWNRALGGSDIDVGGTLTLMTDGGYLVCSSYTASNDGDVIGYHGNNDGWLVKLSATGSIEWTRTVGGSGQDGASRILELDNGDILVLGGTSSSDGDIPFNHGGSDAFLTQLSSSGALIWTRTYGGSGEDGCNSLVPTGDGGCLLAGTSDSIDGDVTSNLGERDIWVLKVDGNGAIIWQRSFGGTLDEWAFMEKGELGGYVLTGISYSNDGDIIGGHGERDLWLARVEDTGALAWQRCLGGSVEDWGYLQAQTSDTGYVVIGYTESNNGDVSGNHGGRDIWVAKLKVYESPAPLECALYIPNAFSPDNSTKNDMHCLYGTDCIKTLTMDIYDRWGKKVFESSNTSACWDGTYKGQPLDPAVFVYHLAATLFSGENVQREGNITLVR